MCVRHSAAGKRSSRRMRRSFTDVQRYRVSRGQRLMVLREERRRKAGAEEGACTRPRHGSIVREAEPGKRREVEAEIDGDAPRSRRGLLRWCHLPERAHRRSAAMGTRSDGDMGDARRGKRHRLVRRRVSPDPALMAGEVTGTGVSRERLPRVPVACCAGERQRGKEQQEWDPNPGSAHRSFWLSVTAGGRFPGVNKTRRARPSPRRKHLVLRPREGLARSILGPAGPCAGWAQC